jgi:hypothetical protein
MVKEILLTQGAISLVSDEDADLAAYSWYVQRLKYALRLSHKDDRGIWVRQYLHRAVMEKVIGRALQRYESVDHIDRNGLNNTRENLRIVNQSQNCANRSLGINSKSGYKGVSWNAQLQKWCAYISFHRKKMHLGYFTSKHDAARAYNAKAIELQGIYANVNDVDERL